MDFDFTAEQLAIRKHMRDFAEREIAPVATRNDRECQFDWEIAKKIFAEGDSTTCAGRRRTSACDLAGSGRFF